MTNNNNQLITSSSIAWKMFVTKKERLPENEKSSFFDTVCYMYLYIFQTYHTWNIFSYVVWAYALMFSPKEVFKTFYLSVGLDGMRPSS